MRRVARVGAPIDSTETCEHEETPPSPDGSWVVAILREIASWLPFAVVVARAGSAGQWRDDLPAIRDLGLVAVGVGGGLSTVVTQTLSLLPLGPRPFRAALGSAIALALAARILFVLIRRALTASLAGPRLGATIAAIATVTAALSPTWQREATGAAGSMIATTLVLAAVWVRAGSDVAPFSLGPRAWVGLGALAGIGVAESPPAGLAITCVVLALFVLQRIEGHPWNKDLPSPPVRVAAAVTAVSVAALLFAPLVLRPLAPRVWVDLGHALSSADLGGLGIEGAHTTAVAAWIREVGFLSLAIAAFGTAFAVRKRKARVLVAPFLVLVGLDLLLPARAAGGLVADPLMALRCLALAALALGSALGIHEVVRRVLAAGFPLARAAAVLVVVFHLTLAALTCEDASFAADRSDQFAAEVWTDEALGRLEPNAAILVRSPVMAWRLWAARLLRGERPDVVVIPIPLLSRGHLAGGLVARDPELAPLLRSYALTGEPSELSLSTLSDVRHLHAEFDPAWTKRLVNHLRPGGLWLEYASMPLGPSDRKQSAAAAAVQLRRVLSAITTATVPEAETAGVVMSALRADVSVLNALGETDAADQVLAHIDELSAREPAVAQAKVPYALKGMRRVLARRSLFRGK